jgi:hypothetical protein
MGVAARPRAGTLGGMAGVAVVACSVIALLVQWLSPQPQFNLQWIVLLLPVHVALAWAAHVQRRLPLPAR